ncbi:MAG: hypothetical protein IJI67_01380 [Clostridia bacterium]|nr:hypothetical protein [Clostridia bacterium]
MRNYHSFAAIIYVTDTEEQAVLRMFEWQDLSVAGDAQAYKEAFIEKNGKKLRVICARQDEMGMTASATLTMKMLYHFVPEYVIMPGIAAGTGQIKDTDKQQYGDVVLANSVWNFSNGKFVSPHQADIVFGEIGFHPRPTSVEVSGDYLDTIMDFVHSDKNEFYVHCGPLASGTAVVANQSILKKQVISGFQDTEGVEMEGYGVAYAAAHAVEPQPHMIIAKSVCDFADERKDDRFQKFAAYTSCGFVKALLEEVLEYTGD